MKLRISCSMGAIALLMVSNMAHAQNAGQNQQPQSNIDAPSNGTVGEIIVTAQRRSEKLQDVPIAISAFTSQQLANGGILNTEDLAIATPSFTAGQSAGYFQPHIRGVGSTANGAGLESPIAVYVDGVYIAATPASIFSLSDAQRVEILKGPQGTLFGRNATGGLIQIVTRDPGTKLQGDVNVSYGNYDTFTGDGYISGPLAENLGGIVSGHISTQGRGYGINIANGQPANRTDLDAAVRGKLVFNAGDAKFTLSGDYNRSYGSMNAVRPDPLYKGALGDPRSSRVWDVDAYIQPYTSLEGGGTSLKGEIPLSFANLVSITAYRLSKIQTQFDYAGISTPTQGISISQNDRQFSQELQLQSLTSSKIKWVLGGYYFWGKSSFDPVMISFYGPFAAATGLNSISIFGTQRTNSYAGFGQVTVPLDDRTNITGGLRYTSEKRSLDGSQDGAITGVGEFPLGPPTTAESTFNKLTWRASIDHRFSPQVMVYASYNRGFKSGGYNPQVFGVPPYKPEVLDAFEAGVKSDLLGRKLRFNLAGFYYNYQNIQVGTYSATGTSYTVNGAGAHIYGIDADLEAFITSNLRVDGGLSLLHDRFSSFPNAPYNIPLQAGSTFPAQCGAALMAQFQAQLGDNGALGGVCNAQGNRLPDTPDWTADISTTYTAHIPLGKIDFNLTYQHSAGYFAEDDNLRRQPPYNLINASVTLFALSGWRVGVFGRNLTNAVVAQSISGTTLSTGATYLPPRTYGVSAGIKF